MKLLGISDETHCSREDLMNIKTILDEYENLIIQALNNVDQKYYKLKTSYNDNGIVRERFFCYELYHQLRLIQEASSLNAYTIDSEIDKSGHPNFNRRHQKNPDFVFHQAGTMENNLIVIEAKGKLYLKGIEKDINTLVTFCDCYQYKRGYLLIYNHNANEVLKYLSTIVIPNEPASKLTLICKKSKNDKAEIIRFSKRIEDLGKKQ